MSKEIYISSTPHETRLAIVENEALTEIYYERENEYTLAGSIYNGKVTRVLPGMQSSFVDIGLERDAFLYITDFMEEAGDAADFEATANSGDHARAPRSEGGRSESSRPEGGRSEGGRGEGRRDRGPRPDRDQQQPRNTEPTDADLFTDAVSGLDPARPVTDSERGERSGSRRGGRNRRDRNTNSDGTPRRDRSEGQRNEGQRTEGQRTDSPSAELAPAAGIISMPDGGDNQDELGEGAPGADGSRRWRGRRGRRGNRSGGTGVGTENAAASALAVNDRAENTGPVANAYADSFPAPDGYGQNDFQPRATDAEEGFDLDAAAAAPTAGVTAEAAPREKAGRGERGGRNDRGGRGRGRGDRGDRGERSDGAAAPPVRVPRGFAPSLDRYQVENHADESVIPYGQEAELPAPSEPIILPGESLSKYRTDRVESPAAAATSVTPATAPEFTASGWDGGFVLPGETLRRREPSAQTASSSRAETPREERGGRDAGGRDARGGNRDRNDRGGRNERGGRDSRGGNRDRNDRGPRAEFAQPQVPPAHAAEASHAVVSPSEPTYLTAPESVPASHLVTPLNTTFVPPPPMPSAAHEVGHAAAPADIPEGVHAAAHPEAEYEPSEGSASYRVDPAPPSEFRQPAPPAEIVPETAAFAEPDMAAAHHTEPVAIELHAAAPNSGDPADLHSVSPELQHALAATDERQLTSVSASGEMHSYVVETETHALPQTEVAEPTAPILHENAVVDRAAHFEPGSGLLEEEMMEEEEETESHHVPRLEAHSLQAAQEFEHDEQETLEGAADLGTMLREMSIDQITRSEPLHEDDEDGDEDFFEEDQEFDSAEADQVDELDEAHDEHDDHAENDEHAEEAGEQHKQEHFAGDSEPRARSVDNGAAAVAGEQAREPRRDGRREERSRRDGRRGDRGRRPSGDRDRGGSSSERGFSNPGASDRPAGDRSRRDGRGGRQSMQTVNLPAISDLLKPGQEILCQIAKEPIAKKGARITSHIALPGRFLVFMPTVQHTGVSRKIESESERRRLREILLSERGEASGGFIVRTAAAGASEEELRSDLRFLLSLWTDIKTRSEGSKSPALIYHDLNLVERVLRDQVTDNFSAIWVDTETEYERVLRFLQRFQPSLIRRVKLYTKETPLFEQFGITEEINKALRSKVWLKSGGSIVINQTEALVAIDINTGKFVGKTARLEDTIVKTNLDAIPEIVRQIRLRDLGGIIIIDFIDMDERKNRNKVMAALEEELKSDRAPSKVLQFNDFGLVAITRKRVKQSLERTLSTTCGVCIGTGMVKSPVTVCNDIYVELRKMHKHLDRGDVMLRVHPEVVKQLKSTTSKWLQEMEEMVGKTILVKSDPSLHPEQFDIH